MKIGLISTSHQTETLRKVCDKLKALDICASHDLQSLNADGTVTVDLRDHSFEQENHYLIDDIVEYVLSKLPIEFDDLPLLVEGDSKIVRSLNDKIVIERFKPTVYSFTSNRYGMVEGTEELRAQFTAEIFRQMNYYAWSNNKNICNAFLGTKKTASGTLILQRRVSASNLEVRVKRYHIGSPTHRYLFTSSHPTTQSFGPLRTWSRFDVPLVCFDWRHPLHDESGNRLADEPLSDDYASIWMNDIPHAKYLAAETFLWLEKLFKQANLLLVDICFFIDQSGQMIFGEISPDCMRVRDGLTDPSLSDSFDKDLWRTGQKEVRLLERYNRLYQMVFQTQI